MLNFLEYNGAINSRCNENSMVFKVEHRDIDGRNDVPRRAEREGI